MKMVRLSRSFHAPPSWIDTLSVGSAKKKDSWPPLNGRFFDWNWPTNEAYHDSEHNTKSFAPDFAQARQRLDYAYHRNPMEHRQELQDSILSLVVGASPKERRKNPWIVFTAGAMGVGKGYVISTLNRAGLFPANKFLKIDPDMINSELPEQAGYLLNDPATAATKLHRESTQMADILFEHALLQRTHLLVDGSLRNADWYLQLFERIRKDHGGYRIGIIHVTASPATIQLRAKQRAERTGRVVPPNLLDQSIRDAPRSVALLKSSTDVTYEISNDEGVPFHLKSLSSSRNNSTTASDTSWFDFARSWADNEDEDYLLDQQQRRNGAVTDDELMCNMATSWNDTEAHDAARAVWGDAYPNFCPRCALSCDGQCGVCIHGRHTCACDVCKKQVA